MLRTCGRLAATLCVLALGLQLSMVARAQQPPDPPRLRALDFSPFAAELSRLSADEQAQIDTLLRSADLRTVQALMAAGQLSAERLTLFFLRRIQQHDERLRSMLELNPRALDEARAADRARAEGRARGLLHGVPVNLKDNIETAAPMHTTAGAALLLDHVAAADAPLVQALRREGAVILGKANLSELAGVVSNGPRSGGTSAVGGEVRNPHGDLPTGGSSAGSAVSTAARLTMLSVGTETSGSLIAPSAWASVVGMKPSRGLVRGEGVVPLLRSNDSAGPIARHVWDAAVLLAAMDTRDVDYTAGLSIDALDGVTVGLLAQDVVGVAGNAAPWQAVVGVLASTGARLRPASLRDEQGLARQPFLRYLSGGLRHDMMPELARRRPDVGTLAALQAWNAADAPHRAPFGQGLLELLVPMADGLDEPGFRALGEQLRQGMAALLDGAFRRSGAEVLASLDNQHSAYYATAGYPAITVPVGRRQGGGLAARPGLATAGLPTGVTLIGKPGQDARLLAFAYAFEQAAGLQIVPSLP